MFPLCLLCYTHLETHLFHQLKFSNVPLSLHGRAFALPGSTIYAFSSGGLSLAFGYTYTTLFAFPVSELRRALGLA